MRAHKFGQKWEIGQKSPALTGLRKTNAAIPIKPVNSSRNQRFREDLEPITANARGGVFRESRRTRGFDSELCARVGVRMCGSKDDSVLKTGRWKHPGTGAG